MRAEGNNNQELKATSTTLHRMQAGFCSLINVTFTSSPLCDLHMTHAEQLHVVPLLLQERGERLEAAYFSAEP